MSWIEPLALETWLINVFAGNATIWAAVSIFVIIGMSAYFRMTMTSLGFMVLIFLLMFSGYIPPELLIFAAVFAGLAVGYITSKIVK
jgi:hypothetical protein